MRGEKIRRFVLLSVLWTFYGHSFVFAESRSELEKKVETLRAKLAVAEIELKESRADSASPPIIEAEVASSHKTMFDTEEVPTAASAIWSYSIRLPVLIGYDTNPTGLSNEVPRRVGLNHRDSALIEINPTLKISRTAADKSKWTFEYSLDKYYFLGQADVNLLANDFKLTHERALTEADAISVTLGDQIRRVDEEAKSNQALLNLGVKHKWNESNSTTVEYSFATTEFALPNGLKIPEVLDPDSETNGVSITETFVLRKSKKPGGSALSLAIGYAFLFTEADGDDQDVNRHRLSVALTGSPFAPDATEGETFRNQLHKLQIQAKYVHDFDDYRNNASKAGSGFQFMRSDNTDRFQMTMTYPIERNLNWEQEIAESHRRRGPVQALWTASYSYSRSDSNIFAEDKDDHVIKAGIIADF